MGQSASKEKFRESVTTLIQVDVSADDADFWDELWKLAGSAEEVFELVPATAARRLRDERFDNLATLFTQAVAQLCQIVETPYNIYFDQALNCVRVLTRILPFLLEKGAQRFIVEHALWYTEAWMMLIIVFFPFSAFTSPHERAVNLFLPRLKKKATWATRTRTSSSCAGVPAD